MKRIRQTILCAAIVIIALSLTMPVHATNVQPTATTLESTLDNGFGSYLGTIHVKSSTVSSGEMASGLFLQFLNAEPQYQGILQQYDRITHPATMKSQSPLQLSSITLGPVISTQPRVINGVTYTVQLQQGTLADGTTVLKATFIGPDGIVDPYIYITISYLTVQVLWWTVTYGEDQWLYEYFVTNSGGVNEAAVFKYKMDQLALQQGVLGGLVAGIAAIATAGICLGCGGLIGVVTTYMWAHFALVMDTGYDGNNGMYIAMQNHYLYTQIGSFTTIWTWFFFNSSWNRAFPAPGLELFALSSSSSSILSVVYHNAANSYGLNRWVWIGTYRG